MRETMLDVASKYGVQLFLTLVLLGTMVLAAEPAAADNTICSVTNTSCL